MRVTRRLWIASGFLAFLGTVVGCASEDDPYDGDGGDGDDDRCSAAADSCTGESICVSGSCAAAYPRVYALTGLQLMAPTTKPDGSGWDVGGGAPDLFVEIAVNDALVAETLVQGDSFSAAFAGPFRVSLIAGASLELRMLDEDVAANDHVFTCLASPLTAAQLRRRELQCTSTGYSVQFRIEPQ